MYSLYYFWLYFALFFDSGLINFVDNSAPVTSYRVSVINLVYWPSSQSLENSFGAAIINVLSLIVLALVCFNHVSKLGLLIFSCIFSSVAVHNSLIFSNRIHPFQSFV